jgi:hypothetical protein
MYHVVLSCLHAPHHVRLGSYATLGGFKMPRRCTNARRNWGTGSDMTHSDTLGCRFPRPSHPLFKHGSRPCPVHCHLRMAKCTLRMVTMQHPVSTVDSYSRNEVILLVTKGYVKKILPAIRSEPYVVAHFHMFLQCTGQQLREARGAIPSNHANNCRSRTKKHETRCGGIWGNLVQKAITKTTTDETTVKGIC